MPAHARACPKCGATLAPVVSNPVYGPLPPRRPEEPERPGWVTAAGWVAVAAVCALIGLFLFRASTEADRRATEKAEVERQVEHMHRVDKWLRDTSANAAVPESPPAPTSDRAKRMWAINRMLVERSTWERGVMERHGVRGYGAPAAWGTPRYWANARSYPEVGRYVEGRVAALAEIEKTSAAWLEERAAALARESGMPAGEIRRIFPQDFAGAALDEAPLADAMLEIHRYLVRVDPRVHHVGGNQLRYEREDDFRRLEELLARRNAAAATARHARGQRVARESAALSP